MSKADPDALARVDAHKARADVAEAAFVESTGELIAANATLAEAMGVIKDAAFALEEYENNDGDRRGLRSLFVSEAHKLRAFLARHQAQKGGDAVVQPGAGLEPRQVAAQPLSSQSAGGADIDAIVREVIPMFSSPTIGRGDIHGGQKGWVVYEHDGLPFIAAEITRRLAAATAQEGGWRTDMENAPRNCRLILMVDGQVREGGWSTKPDYDRFYVSPLWRNGEIIDQGGYPAMNKITAWRLPPPPKPQEGGK